MQEISSAKSSPESFDVFKDNGYIPRVGEKGIGVDVGNGYPIPFLNEMADATRAVLDEFGVIVMHQANVDPESPIPYVSPHGIQEMSMITSFIAKRNPRQRMMFHRDGDSVYNHEAGRADMIITNGRSYKGAPPTVFARENDVYSAIDEVVGRMAEDDIFKMLDGTVGFIHSDYPSADTLKGSTVKFTKALNNDWKNTQAKRFQDGVFDIVRKGDVFEHRWSTGDAALINSTHSFLHGRPYQRSFPLKKNSIMEHQILPEFM